VLVGKCSKQGKRQVNPAWSRSKALGRRVLSMLVSIAGWLPSFPLLSFSVWAGLYICKDGNGKYIFIAPCMALWPKQHGFEIPVMEWDTGDRGIFPTLSQTTMQPAILRCRR
jgi:hypothetical protein